MNREVIPISKLEMNRGQVEGLPKNPRFFRDSRFEAMKKSIEDCPEMLDLRELIVYPYGDKYLAADYGDCSVIKDREKVTRIIRELYDLAEVLDVHVFGFTNRTTPMMYEENAWLSFSKMITGCSYGVRYKKGVTWWNDDLKLKEDFWISCFAKFKERRILTDLRYSFSQKDTFVNPGGLSAFRNVEEERRSILLIRKHFGECIQMKGGACNNGKGSTKQMVEYNISVKFPF